jgi:uncharacterized protein YbjT (DUF2867 family)
MYVISGATGRVGSAAANALLDAGAPVRVLVRGADAAERWRIRGAETWRVDLRDRSRLAEALRGARGCFAMLPFDVAADDLESHTRTLIDAIAGAVADSGVPHVAMLSSGGADLESETGPITHLHALEHALVCTGVRLTAIRPGHFQEKVRDVLDAARLDGVYPVFADSADVGLAMVATADVGRVVADVLLSPPPSDGAIDVVGPEYTEREVAGLLGEMLGRTLEVITLPRAAWIPTLSASGLPLSAARLLAELYDADQRGLLAPRGDRVVHGDTDIRRTIAELHYVPNQDARSLAQRRAD